MSPVIAENLPLIIGIIVLALIALFIVMRLNRRAKVVSDDSKPATKDVLDDGADRAKRNEALINAPRAVENNFGATSSRANSDTIATAGEMADAEAGVSVAPTVGDPVPPPLSEQKPAKEAAQTPGGATDDLTKIKGLGPKLSSLLNEQGVTSFAQIAAWSASDVESMDAKLGRFAGRITRDNWVEQAKLLEKGDESGFAEKFGQNG